MDVPERYGGLELGMTEQVAVWEQLGRVTNALCWCFSEAQQWMFAACDEGADRYVYTASDGRFPRRMLRHYRGRIRFLGSDRYPLRPGVAGGYRINGEKCYVTSANHADYFFLQARLENGEQALFFVDIDSAGVVK